MLLTVAKGKSRHRANELEPDLLRKTPNCFNI